MTTVEPMEDFVSRHPERSLAVVSGFYERRELAKRFVASVRRAAGQVPYQIVAVDGGSRDGTREWLADQSDVFLIGERGPLRGAVRAYNRAFAHCVDEGFGYVAVFNDDDEIVDADPPALERAVKILADLQHVGGVAFETDLRRNDRGEPWRYEEWHGRAYANKGVFRRDAGMAAARAQGDPSGRRWWTPEHRHYASDTEFGLWIWRLGWMIRRGGSGCRVRDGAPDVDDALRRKNVAEYDTQARFLLRWHDPSTRDFDRVDALRFGGLVPPEGSNP